MANLFLAIPVPSADGPGAAVNISAFGWVKSFSVVGNLIGNITLEISNDNITWNPIATLVVPGDICTSFASMFVRANVAGYVSGAAIMAVGSDDAGTLTAAVSVPPGNGTGAPVNISAFGQKKTVLYSGGTMYTDLTVIVEISEDGVTFSELASFSGPVPAARSFECSLQSIRTTVIGFVSGVVTVSVSAVNDPASGSDTLQQAYDASTGVPVDIQLSVVNGGIRILGAPGVPDPLFAVVDNAGNIALAVQSAPASAVVIRNLTLNDGGTAAFLEGDSGSTAPVSAASTGRIRYNEVAQKWQISENGGAYFSLDGITTLQEAYDASVGTPVNIQLAAVRGGIRILDVAAQTTPSFEVSSSASPQDSIMVTRTFAGGGIGIDVSMAVGTTGTGINISHSGSGAPFAITHSAGAATSWALTRTPGVVTAGTGINIVYGANTTGIVANISQSGSGNVIQVTNTGAGAILNLLATGAGQVASWSHSGTNATPFSWNNSSNTAGVSTSWTRLPTVATGGTIFRLSSNINFTGISLEIISGGAGGTDTGILMIMRGSGAGASFSDQAPNAHTGTMLALQHNITGSTGLLLSMAKNPAAATAGDLCSITMGVNTSGNVWTISQSGTGHVFNVTETATGTGRLVNTSWLGTGEIWRFTGTAGAILNVRTVDGREGIGVVPATNGTGVSPLLAYKRQGAGFANSEGQMAHGTGTTVGAVSSQIITLALLDNTTYILWAKVAGRDAGGVNRGAYILAAGVFRQAAGVATFIDAASPSVEFVSRTVAGLTATFDVSGNNVRVTVTGIAAQTIHWAADLWYEQVTTSA